MEIKKRLGSAFFICSVITSGIAEASIPQPPEMEPVQSEPHATVEVNNSENTLNKTFSTEVDFDYAYIREHEPLQVADVSSNASSTTTQTPEVIDNTEAAKAANGGYTDAEVAEMINNPLGKLWLIMIQNDYISYDGDYVRNSIGQNTTLIQPVMPFQLTDNVKLIFRPVIPINSFETIDSIIPNGPIGSIPTDRDDFNVGLQRESGLGDIVLWTAFATNEMAKPPNVYGVGITAMLDTASEKELGTGQNSVGPMAMALHIDDSWIYGVVAQHWWSIDEDKDRDDVSLTDIQYIGRYRYSKNTNIGFSPNIRYNWEADGSDRWTIPIGIGVDTMIKMGPLPVKVGVEVHHYVKQPDKFGPDWQIRFFFIPVLPSPKWTQKALF